MCVCSIFCLMSGAFTLKTAISPRSLMQSSEALRVLSGSDTDDAKKRPAHRICRSEATCICDLLESHRGAVDHLLCGFNSHTINELTGIHIHLTLADTGKVTGAHAYTISKSFDAKIFSKIFEHPYLQFTQGL